MNDIDIWKLYYPNTNQESHTISDNTSFTVYSNYFLLSSNFQGLTSGVIYCSTSNINLLHSLCTFIQNSNSQDGGIIHFSCSSSIVQDRFCSINSYSSSNGEHSYISVSSVEQKSYIIESTLFACGQGSGSGSIFHLYGTEKITSSNISNCSTDQYTGYTLKNGIVIIKSCYFCGNKALSNGICMYHYQTPNSNISNSVFIENSATVSSEWSLVFLNSNDLTVSNGSLLIL